MDDETATTHEDMLVNDTTHEDMPVNDTWMNPDIIPFTKQHEQMLTEIHTAITDAFKQIESAMPMLLPLLNGLGVSL